MSAPKPFQLATADVAMRAFDRRRSVRRFLVADEAGLGKTVVAREIIKRMMAKKRADQSGPLCVFYVCSSLAIASQNRDNLLKVLPPELRRGAASQVDRLTLAPNQVLSPELPLHLYTLTPDTSIPDRRGKHRSGGAMERALLHNLLHRRYPELVSRDGSGEWLQCNATTYWAHYKQHHLAQPKADFAERFFARLRRDLGLEEGQQLPAALRRCLDANHMDTIKTLRVSLAGSGLDNLNPDLVIFDEFQKFSDVLAGEHGGSEIARQMTGSSRAVLLLSATPYHLYGGDFENAFGEPTHHLQFYNLVEWLLGADASAKAQRTELETAFRRYADALRSSQPGGQTLLDAKTDVETRLCKIIARTERFGHSVGQEAVELKEQVAPLLPEDLQAYRHLSDCFAGAKPKVRARTLSCAVPYWSSIPLSMQMLGQQYKAWLEAKRDLPPSLPRLHLTKAQRNQFRGPPSWPHARMRALASEFSPKKLSVPWLAPSFPWWKLGDQWLDQPPEKVLLFSRFRAVPRAVAALLSFDVERHLLQGKGHRYKDITERTVFAPSAPNFAFFHPSLALAGAFDPWTVRGAKPTSLPRLASAAMTAWLNRNGITVVGESNVKRQLSVLVVGVERTVGAWSASFRAWQNLAEELSRKEGGGDKSFRGRINAWDKACPEEIRTVSSGEVRLLARMALSSPGVVLARAFQRAGLSIEQKGDGQLEVLRASWEGMRSYLNNPWMENALVGDGEIRERVGKAIVSGNLESVLDEHLWLVKLLRGLDPADLPKSLATSLALRTSDVHLHAFDQPEFSLRAHAALAFSDKAASHRPDRKSEEPPAVRTDELLQAFNSPFWPHVLASTSVGQEGLDFHFWCSTVAHWDIPSDPVDLEQREGRVDRFGGIATRRAMASGLGAALPAPTAYSSPWAALATLAERAHENDPSGLAPWWLYPGAKVRRIVFDVPLSEAKQRFEQLKEQRMLYRLALGQPDQEDLVRALRGRLSADEVRAAAINLSPWAAE